jgi:hypothetical protein
MRRTSSPFKWRHYAPDVILLCIRWYHLTHKRLTVGSKWRHLNEDIFCFKRMVP